MKKFLKMMWFFNDKNIKSIILRDKNSNKILKVEFKDFPYLGVLVKTKSYHLFVLNLGLVVFADEEEFKSKAYRR